MNFITIIDANISKFKKDNGFESIDDNTLFEIYINHLFARKNKFYECMNEYNRFDLTNVGGDDDSGIDGIFIKLNGSFVYSKQDIDSVVKNSTSLDLEFIFIQSKNKNNIDTGELGKFFSGIKNFLSSQQLDTVNNKISDWIELKEYLYSPDFLVMYTSQPKVLAVFAYKGKNLNDNHVAYKIKEFIKDINMMDCSREPIVEILDGEGIFELAKKVDNNCEVTIRYYDSFELKGSEDVESSVVLLCKAEDLLKLLIDDNDGALRREIFNDNVRDYQGETTVNREIYETISNNPSKFCLLNNGITIVCKSCLSMNRQITLINPQIVNGCQTCTSIFNARRDGLNISDVDLIVKVIATDNSSVMNAIIKGTNRQNIVYSESFEITREFHKNFEQYVKSIQINKPITEKIYYERRSNQLSGESSINSKQIFGLGALTQSFVSTFLLEPHRGFEHEIDLLEKYDGQIFRDGDCYKAYFTSALLYLKLDQMFKERYETYRFYNKYRYQIMCIFIHLVAGRVPSLNNNNLLEKYCGVILDVIYDPTKFKQFINQSITLFDSVKNKWIEEKGPKFIHSIKDNSTFDSFMLSQIGYPYEKFNAKNKEDFLFEGVVTTVKKDRNGFSYCYIKADPVDVFVHEDNSPGTIFSSLSGKLVKYKIISSGRFNNPKGKIVKVYPRTTKTEL